jgi:hypothetical protein
VAGNGLAGALAQESWDDTEFAAPDDDQIGSRLTSGLDDRVCGVADGRNQLGVDAVLTGLRRRVLEFLVMVLRRIRGINARATAGAYRERGNACDDQLRVESLRELKRAFECALGRLGIVVSDKDCLHGFPPSVGSRSAI